MAGPRRKHVKYKYLLRCRRLLDVTHLLILFLPNANAIVLISSINVANVEPSSASSSRGDSAVHTIFDSFGRAGSGDVAGSPLGLFLDDVGMKKADIRRERLYIKNSNQTTDKSRSQLGEITRGTEEESKGPSASPWTSPNNYHHLDSGLDGRVEYIAHVYIMPGFLVLGFVNQCLNIMTLSSLPLPGYLYLKASAVADTLSILAIIPFCIRHGNIHNPYSYWAMLYHAHVELPLINSFITASALCLVGMTIDRYVSIRHPIAFFNSADSRARIRLTIAVIFTIAFLIFIPSAWQKEVIPDALPGTSHTSITDNPDYEADMKTRWRIQRNYDLNHSTSFKIYLLFREFIARIGPILILVVLNAEMIRSLRRITARQTERRARHNSVTRARDNDRHRISVLLLITSATFVICTLPASLLSLFIDYTNDGLGMQIFRAFANLLQVTHFLFNFYLYAIFSKEYRVALLSLVGCRKGRSPGTTDASPVQLLSNSRLAQRAARTMKVIRYEKVNSNR